MFSLSGDLLPPSVPAERIVACVALLSDTHAPDRCAALPPALFTALRGADLVLHAGDVGELWVLDQLSAIAPVIAVHGNDDTAAAQRELPYQQLLAIAGQRVLLCHAHEPDPDRELAERTDDTWLPKLARRAALGRRAGATVVVFGHTHVPLAHLHDGLLLVNPGAIASPNGTTRQRLCSVALLFLTSDGAAHVTHIDLASPTDRFEPVVDWHAGFRSALDDVSTSILSRELARVLPRLEREQRALFAPAYLRLARRCWQGTHEFVDREQLLEEIEADNTIPAEERARLRATLTADSRRA